MKESGLTPPRMPKEWETTRKSGFQTGSQQPSPSMQSHKARTTSGRGRGPRLPLAAGWGPGQQETEPTAWQDRHASGRQRPGRRAAPFVQSLLQQGGSGEAPRGEGELWGAQQQPVGVGRHPVKKGSFGAPSCSLWVWGGCGQAGRGASVGLIGAVFSDSSGWSCVGNCKSQGSCLLGSSSPGRCGPDCHRGLASWAGAAEADCWRPCFLGSAAGRGAQSLSLEPSTQQGPSLKSVSSR